MKGTATAGRLSSSGLPTATVVDPSKMDTASGGCSDNPELEPAVAIGLSAVGNSPIPNGILIIRCSIPLGIGLLPTALRHT